MKRRAMAILAGLALLAAVPARAEEFPIFWKAFAAAAAKDDRAAIRRMMKFPILFGSTLREAKDFDLVYKGLFGAKERRCLAKAKPVKDPHGAYDVFCGSVIYIFTSEADGWRLSDTGEND